MRPSKPWMLPAALVLVFSCLGAMGITPARADDEAKAAKLLEEGDKYLARGDKRMEKGREKRAMSYYERALDRYQKAYELVPKPSLFFAIAEAEAKLGRHVDAALHYQQVIAEVDSQALKDRAGERLEALAAHVGKLVIKVTPESAEVTIDAQSVALTGGPLWLAPGEHVIQVKAEGYKLYEENVVLEAGASTERAIILKAEAGMGTAALDEAADPDADPDVDEQPRELRKEPKWAPKPSATKVILGGALTVGFLAGATTTGLLALSKHGEFESAQTPEERDAARSAGRPLALVTDILIAGTVVAGAYTVYQYMVVYRPGKVRYERDQERRKDPKFWVTAVVDGEGAGLALVGRF